MSKSGGKRARRLGSIERDILQGLSTGDLFYGFLLSARSGRRMYKLAREHADYRRRRKRALERLLQEKFIVERLGKLSLTDAGRNLLGDAVRSTRALLQNNTWDGKWRVVIFDIPEPYTPLRNRVRSVLKRAGFVQLQQSVWIFPHDCEELSDLIRTESRLPSYILYGVLERIQEDARLRKHFKLG